MKICCRTFSCLIACLWLAIISVCVQADAGSVVEAARKQDWETVRMLLQQKSDVNPVEADGTSALAWAVYRDKQDMVVELLQAGADVNLSNYLGISPLMLATRNLNAGIANLLLEAGADTDHAMWSGETVLMTAARMGATAIVESLLENGADINKAEPRRGQTALMWAIAYQHPETARVLVEHGADVHARTRRLEEQEPFTPMQMEGYGGNVLGLAQGGYTPLMFAARAGDRETAELLLKQGAAINDVAVEDGSPLIIAAAWGHEALALMLLENGADPKAVDANGMTALHYAMREGLKQLLGYKLVQVTRVCGFKTGPTCRNADSLSADEILKLKDPSAGFYQVHDQLNIDNDGNERVILPGPNMYELAEALLARGADVNAAMKYPPAHLRLDHLAWMNLARATPFFLATASLDQTAIEMMLEFDANPNVTTEVDQAVFNTQTKEYTDDNQIAGNATPLMVVAGLGRQLRFTPEQEAAALTIARRLIALGADVNAATATGWTALHAAAFNGANSLVQLLVDSGAAIDVQNGCGRTPLSLAAAENDIGLIARSRPKEKTVELLRTLGAGKMPAAGPVGECVLGRYQYQPEED